MNHRPDPSTITETDAVEPSDRFGHLFHLIGDAVVEVEIVDMVPVVRAVNPGFEELFGYGREEIRGESLNEFIVPDTQNAEAESFDRRTARGKENHAIVSRRTVTGVREFLYRGVPYEREDGSQYGFAIYSDISDQRAHERHLQVLHRMLRHDLRNSLSVILGMTHQLERSSDDPVVSESAATIRRHANDLVSAGEEMRHLEEVLVGEGSPAPVDLTSLCRETAKQYGDRADLTVETPGPVEARGIPQLRDALGALVENAIEHGGPSLVVRLGVPADDRIVVSVADNGPGVPEHERRGVFDDRSVTQLEHGSGIGLWLARLTVDACGGHVEYERDDGWTVIRLVLRPA